MMMSARRFASAIAVVLLVISATSCSSGGGKQSAPTTSKPPTTAAHKGPDPLQQPRHQLAINRRLPFVLGCPPKPPTESLTTLNAGTSGLGEKLVPYGAGLIRVCRYLGERPQGGVTQNLPGVVPEFEDETNALPIVAHHPGDCGCDGACMKVPTESVVTFVTFVGTHVVTAELVCATVTNGVLSVRPTTKWLNELAANLRTLPGESA